MRLELIQTETPECITLNEAKTFCRVDILADDALITLFITQARMFAEKYINSIILPQSYRVFYDYKDNYCSNFYMNGIELPHRKIIRVKIINSFDSNNVETEFDSENYRLSGNRIVLNNSVDWPIDLRYIDALSIDYVAGFGTYDDGDDEYTSDVPEDIKLAMKMLIAHWYEQREAQSEIDFKNVPFGVTALLSSYRNFVL